MTWSWHFHSVDQLRAALEEYSEFHDGAKVQRYGDEVGGTGGSDGKRMRIMRQNSEIDRRMAILESRAPWVHRLIRTYFLHGLCAEHEGWVTAAKRCGLEANRESRWAQDAFEHQVAWCVERLWYAK